MLFASLCLSLCLSLDLSLPDSKKTPNFDDLFEIHSIVDAIGLVRTFSENKNALLTGFGAETIEYCGPDNDSHAYIRDTVVYSFSYENIYPILEQTIYDNLNSIQVNRINFWLSSPIGQKFIDVGGLATLNFDHLIDKQKILGSTYLREKHVEDFTRAVYSKRLLSEFGSLWFSKSEKLDRYKADWIDASAAPINYLKEKNNIKSGYAAIVNEQVPLYMSKFDELQLNEIISLTSFFNTHDGYLLSKVYLQTYANIFSSFYSNVMSTGCVNFPKQ